MIESKKKSPTAPVSKNMPPRQIKQNNTNNLRQANNINQNINNEYYYNNKNIKQKTQFKTSRIVLSIIIQPIAVGLILLSILTIAKTNIEAIGLGAIIFFIDIAILSILLNPNKKEIIEEEIIPQQFVNNIKYIEEEEEEEEEECGFKIDNYDPFIEDDINILDKSDSSINNNSNNIIIDEETDILDEETDILDEETDLIEEAEPVVMPDYILEVDNNEVVENIEVVHEESYVIGRQAQLQNYITNTGVSRRHIEIIKENDEFYLRDLQSKNGTRINNIRMASGEQKKLNDNDIIDIPDLVITFKLYVEEK